MKSFFSSVKVSCCLSRLQEKNNLWTAFFSPEREKKESQKMKIGQTQCPPSSYWINDFFILLYQLCVREKEGWMDGERESAYGGRDMLLSFIFKFLVMVANVVKILNCAVMEEKLHKTNAISQQFVHILRVANSNDLTSAI